MNKRFALLSLGLVVASFIVLGVSGSSKAFSNVYPDPNDVETGAVPRSINGETQFVRKTDSNLRVWFPTTTGTITIKEANFCPGNSTNPHDSIASYDWTGSNTIPNAKTITSFNIPGQGPIKYGRKYAPTNTASCGVNLTWNVTIPASQKENGFYYVDLDVAYVGNLQNNAGVFDGVRNYYLINASAGARIGVRAATNLGYDTTLRQVDTTPHYTNFYGRFGTACTVTTPQSVGLSFYDLDNATATTDGGDGAQTAGHIITVRLVDVTDSANPVYVRFTSASDGSLTNGNGVIDSIWTPGKKNNGTQTVRYTALPQHKYIMYVYNVDYNNIIQYSLPYSQIYRLDCPANTVLTPSVKGTPSINRGSSATFTLHDKVTGFSAPNKTYTYNVNYSFDDVTYSPLPNDPTNIANSTVYAPRNKTLTISSDVDRDISPVVQFRPAFLAGHNKICLEFNIANGGGMTVSGNPGKYCTNIVDPGAYTISITANDHEKGSGNKTVTGTLSTTNGPCDPSVATGNVVTTVTWRISGPGVNATTTSNVQNCNDVITNAVQSPSVSAATLDGLGAGGSATYVPSVSSYTGINPVAAPTLNNGTINVFAVPYATFSGNDIYACGGGTTTSDGKIIFNTSDTNSALGASVEYAALALSGFNDGVPANITTAFGHGSANALKGSLANNSTTPCGFNVSTFKPAATTAFSGPNLPASAGFYEASGATTISGTTTKKVTVYVNGDITISSNGVGASGSPAVPFVDNDNVPYVLLVATGNIYIAPGVTTINAVLIANGTISTCSTGGSLTAPATSALIAGCGNTLTINGAVQANNILFRRSPGTRLLGDTPAERVLFPPYMHFATPKLEDTSKSGYQALFNAPPYL